MTQPSFDFDAVAEVVGAGADDAVVAVDAQVSPVGVDPVADTLSIREAVKRLNEVLHQGFGGLVWVRGEIHNAKRSGHNRYFDLVDDSEGSADVRQRPKVSGILWSKTYQRVAPRLERAGLRLAEGLCVRMRGSFEVYGPSGKLSFNVVDVDPEFTLGNLAVQRDQLLKRLAAEGLLEANGEIPMPLVPLRVGVVTSRDSDGWRDFRTNLHESGIGFQLHLASAAVQGANAPIQVSRAVRRLADRRDLDVIVVVRGGGSKSDLATFDHEHVARAIAASPIPVLTGIGHDNDRSIADEVAHTASKTPTACAQVLIDRVRRFERELDRRSAQLGHLASRRLNGCRRTLDERGERMQVCASTGLSGSQRRLLHTSRDLAASTRRTLDAADAYLMARHERVRRAAERSLREESRLLDTRRGALARTVPSAVARAQHHLDLVAAKIGAVDPRTALERGWSITTTADGHLVRRVAEVAAGSELTTRLRDGRLTSTVRTVQPDPGSDVDLDEELDQEAGDHV